MNLKNKKLISIYFSVIVIIISFILNWSLFKVFLVLIIINLFYYLILYLVDKYNIHIQKLEFEKQLINNILSICALDSVNLKLIIYKFASSKSNLISKEFSFIKFKLNQGHKIDELFKILRIKYNSNILNKFLDLLLISRTLGTTSNNDFKYLVENFLDSKNIIKQRESLLLLQKYTIFMCSAIVLPAIISVVIELVKSLNTSLDFSSFGFIVSSNLFSTVYYCALIYIFEYILISSFYLSFIENNNSKFIVYLLILLPISIFIFFISKYII